MERIANDEIFYLIQHGVGFKDDNPVTGKMIQ